MRESDGNKRRYLKMAAAILLALVLVCSVFIIVFSSISSTSSRYSESETYSGNVVAGEHDLDHTGWQDFNKAYNEWYEEHVNSSYTTQLFNPSGRYFLSSDLVVSTSITVNLSEGEEFTLCLNGHNLSMDTKYHNTVIRFSGNNATFNLYDCGGETVNTRYYKLSKLSNASGLSYLADYLCFYDFSVTDEEISQIKSGQIEGGCIEGGLISGGSNLGNGNWPGGIEIEKNSTFNMYGGTIAGNWTDEDGYGGGVYVLQTAVFNMYGGSIEGNANGFFSNERRSGGGVLVGGGFNMYGGTISNNYAKAGGGVELSIAYDCSFNMYGGTISNNYAEEGGGVEVNSGKFSMHEGTISNNYAEKGGGVFAYEFYSDNENEGYNSDMFEMVGGTIADNQATNGGGVYLRDVDFKMDGGEITGNEAECRGGGVYVQSGSFEMSDGSVNENCCLGKDSENDGTICGGGGVAVSGGTFTMKEGNETVSDNRSTNGGGVLVDLADSDYAQNAKFEMKGGSLIKNDANNGGGLYLSQGDFEMSGGKIENNVATADVESFVGGGVYTDMKGSIVLTGAPYIYDNYRRTSEDDENSAQCNLAQDANSDTAASKYLIIYVADEALHLPEDELQEGSKIGVTLPDEIKRVTWDAYVPFAPGVDPEGDLKKIAAYFVSDDDSYEVVETNSGNNYWLALQQKT